MRKPWEMLSVAKGKNSMELEELRKRLLGPDQTQNAAAEPSPVRNAAVDRGDEILEVRGEDGTSDRGRENGIVQNGARSPLWVAVDSVFQPTRSLREHFAYLARMLETLEGASRSTRESLERVSDLHRNLAELADAFKAVTAFTGRVRGLAQRFQPIEPLHGQFDQLVEAFHANLGELLGTLKPAGELHARARELADALGGISTLESELSQLANAFQLAASAPESPKPPESAQEQPRQN